MGEQPEKSNSRREPRLKRNLILLALLLAFGFSGFWAYRRFKPVRQSPASPSIQAPSASSVQTQPAPAPAVPGEQPQPAAGSAPAREEPEPEPAPAVLPPAVARGPAAGKKWTSPAAGMEFAWIPALNIWVGKYEATNGEYRKYKPEHDSKSHGGHSLNGDRQPVVYVNFNDAMQYAVWMTEQDRERLGGLRYRLPTEREWLTFSQCGDGREYPWGDNWPPKGKVGNYDDEIIFDSYLLAGEYKDGHPVTCDVEDSVSNPWGLYGVGGNVSEACASDARCVSYGARRGASWYSGSRDDLSCASRAGGTGVGRYAICGFRLALAPQ